MTHDRIPLWLSVELEGELRRLASDSGIPMMELVEDALRDFMFRNAPTLAARGSRGDASAEGATAASSADAGECIPCGERRACCRRSVAVPAVVHTTDQDGRTGRYRVAEMRDISSSGIGLRFEGSEREPLHIGRDFEVLFQFAERMAPMRMACTACRKVGDGTGFVVGAVFHEPFTDPGFTASA